jgi:ribonuclease HI
MDDAALVAGAIAAELRLLEPSVRRDRDEVARVLDPDFREIGRSGRLWTREEMLDAIEGFESSSVRVVATEISGERIADGLVLVTYETHDARRSSLWRHDGSSWRILFHQGTPVPS